jgi:hypothetical protein
MNHTLMAATPSQENKAYVHALLGVIMVCFLIGTLQLLGAGSMGLLWLSVCGLSAVGFLGLGALLTMPTFATPWSINAVSLALGYGFGALNTMLRGYAEGNALLTVTNADIASLGRAEGGVMLVVAALLLIGHLDGNKLTPRVPFSANEQKTTLLVLSIVALGAVFSLATGKLGIQGTLGADEGSGGISAFAALVSGSLAVILACAAFAFANETKPRARQFLVAALCMVLVGTLLIQGRRVFMYGALVGIIGFFAAKGAKKLFTVKSMLILMCMALMVMAASRFYFAMRIAGDNAAPSITLMERLDGAVDVLLHAENEGFNDRLTENEGSRTFIIGYLAELLQMLETHDALGGDVLILNAATSVPTVIWPGKWAIMARGGSDENLCHPQLGLPLWDAANTSLTAGACDFSWFGLILYPLGVSGLYALFNRLLRGAPTLIKAVACFSTFAGLIQAEITLSSYMVGIRNITVMCSLIWLLLWLVTKHDCLAKQRKGREKTMKLADSAQ